LASLDRTFFAHFSELRLAIRRPNRERAALSGIIYLVGFAAA